MKEKSGFSGILPGYHKGNQSLGIALLLVLLSLFTGCTPGRHTSGIRYQAKDSDFYNEYSQKLGFPLVGNENPVLVQEVSSWLGTPYKYGGETKSGTDCSGFALSVYKKVYGLNLPRITSEMAKKANKVKKRNLSEGDLVFFRTKRRRISHVGIYLGQGYFIHASTSRGVIVNHLEEDYYQKTFDSGGKIKP